MASAIARVRDDSGGVAGCCGASGGKDSTVLLSVLVELGLDAEFVAVTVDEGIAGSGMIRSGRLSGWWSGSGLSTG